MENKTLIDGVMGLAVGDALGVPVEFMSRKQLKKNPVTDMIGYGTHNQPPGTWSDDTSLTLCLCDSIRKKGMVDYTDIMKRFRRWLNTGQYTPHGKVFDVGNTTKEAILRFNGRNPIVGGTDIGDNGNGSLMRVLPLAFYFYGESQNTVYNVSALTHGHIISKIACDLYIQVAVEMLMGKDVRFALERACSLYRGNAVFENRFNRLATLHTLVEQAIQSTGYVVDTLEAALWCVMKTDNYRDCVLKAVNLGNDTDTVAAVAGGLAGIQYGMKGIPADWLDKLANKDLIKKCLF